MLRPCFLFPIMILIAACVEPNEESELNIEPSSWQKMVTGDQWRILASDFDPFIGQQSSRKACGILDYAPEYDGVEISTKFCDYMSLVQLLSFDIKAGEILRLNIWHSILLNNSSVNGLISIQIADQEIWTQSLNIPGPAESWTLEFASPRDFETGDRVIFHVHNHGANSYTLNELSVARYPN